VLFFLCSQLSATDIDWSIGASKSKLLANAQPMTPDFRFELGVFRDGFVPTAANKSDWASKWSAAQRVAYNATTGVFTGQFTVEDNITPFTFGATAWIWGFQGDYHSGEWILFRRDTWLWPLATDPINNPFPMPVQWSATDANEVVVGNVNSSGIQSEVVSNVLPPETSWAVWQEVELASTSLKGPNEDADGDGAGNLLEFAFGTDPLRPGSLPPSTLTKVMLSGQPYLQLSIPRRANHMVSVTMEVSGNLKDWFSGPLYVTTVSDTPSALVLRDLTVLGSSRFARARVTLP
jgi:hypothetical protein